MSAAHRRHLYDHPLDEFDAVLPQDSSLGHPVIFGDAEAPLPAMER
jgi:hypothetical protein